MVSNSDLQKWQQAINNITAAQNELAPEELSAVSALVSLINSGNFQASESGSYIQILKNGLQQHVKNRLLQLHLKNFVALCEKYFRTRVATPTGSLTRQTNTSGKTKSSGSNSILMIIIIGIVLAVGYYMVKDTQWFGNLFSKGIEGTYIPKNEMAKNLYFSKMEFKGNKIKCYMGMMGMALPVAYEYRYSMNGTTVSFEAGIPGMSGSVEFTYDKDKQELSLLTGSIGGAMDRYLPVWGKEGTFDPNTSYSTSKPAELVNEKPAQPVVQGTTPTSDHNTTPGRFPQASERLLTVSDLQNLSKNDLKIMRNEIFARHGYIFQTDEMKTYFKYQDWYRPRYSDVNSMLTSIEQKNIELIKRYE